MNSLPSLNRRLWLGSLLVAASPQLLAAPKPSAQLPLSASLHDELALALARSEPLVVMVSLVGCGFCRIAREHYLAPLQAEGQLAVVQLDMRSPHPTTDFAEQPLTHDELVRRWGVKIAPTVLFFGADGVEVAERLVGGSLPDFYGAYLDQRLELARQRVRAGA